MKNPCKDCTERNIECHCGCDRYKEYKRQLQEVKNKKWEQNKINSTCYTLVDNRFRSLKKKQVKRGEK